MISISTRGDFEEFKKDYDVYGTHTYKDKYLNESTIRDEQPKLKIHTMWHPLRDEADVAEYGQDINKMFYCIIYDAKDIKHNDVVVLYDEEYEIVSIKRYNTHTRLDVKKKKV